MPFDLILFDCDGVLVDSEPIANQLFTTMVQELGAAMTPEENDRLFRGRSMESCRKILSEHLGREISPAFFDEFHDRLFARLRLELKPVDGIHEALDQIKIPSCVASSGSHEKMQLTLNHCGLWDRFAGRIFSAHDVTRGKPFPDLFLHAAKTLDVDPARCAVIEDSLPGIQAAVAAGMKPFAYEPFGATQAMRENGAVIFSDMRQLPELLV
jgi:HAD superfamily hydrolase (TIGR01509 family)